jgi:hypothetical protein
VVVFVGARDHISELEAREQFRGQAQASVTIPASDLMTSHKAPPLQGPVITQRTMCSTHDL